MKGLWVENEGKITQISTWLDQQEQEFVVIILSQSGAHSNDALLLTDTEISNHAAILPLGEAMPILEHSYFIPDAKNATQRKLRKLLSLGEGCHFVLMNSGKRYVACKSAGRYLVFDKQCHNFPWNGGARKMLQGNYSNVQEMSELDHFGHIPRTCFLYGNEEKIAHITIPVIDHMREIMAKVITFQSFKTLRPDSPEMEKTDV